MSLSKTLSNRLSLCGILTLGVLVPIPALVTPAMAQGRESAKSPLDAALQRGDYMLARQLALRHDDTTSMLARSQLAQLDGSLKEALRLARIAKEQASRPDEELAASVRVANLLFELGEWRESEVLLRNTLKAYPDAHEVRLELGLRLLARGEVVESKPILDFFTSLYNDGRLKTSDDLLLLARAMHAQKSYDDANYAFQQAHDLEPGNTQVLVYWGELFLEKYNAVDALKNFEDALKINPRHARALVGKAAVEMMRTRRADEVMPLLDRVAEVAPEYPEMWLLKAHMALRDSDYKSAAQAAQRVLKQRPRQVDALTVLAIIDYLQDDAPAFAQSSKAVLEINPRAAEFWAQVGEYGVMVHRYVEAMDLYRKALAIDPQNSTALVGLGIGFSRINKEDEGIEYLNRAFEVDPYNMRAYNMVELYEKTMPSYSFKEYAGYKVRAHNAEFEMINLFVGPVVEDAMTVFTKKYDYTPEPGLAVEIYPDAATFGVRSVGLPHVSPHGICFGRVVTVRSPSDGNFNWRQVVWHELAHVYHLQLSRSRVPRWFTEGLAEYETNIHDPGWQRHHDRELAIQVFHGAIPSVLELDFGFTHAKSQVEVLRAYHLASLSLHYIAETWGFEKIVGMLHGFAKYNDTQKVIKAVLGSSVQDFDQGFKSWLERRLMNFEHQLMLSIEDLPTQEQLTRKLKLNKLDALAQAQMAMVRAQNGEMDEAERALEAALTIDAKSVDVNFAAVFVRMRQQRSSDVLAHGEKILASFKDGYSLRVAMANASLDMGDVEGARVHLSSAVQLYEGGRLRVARAWRAGKAHGRYGADA